MPTEKSQIIEWLCRDNLPLPKTEPTEPTAKGNFIEVAESCFCSLSKCVNDAARRQFMCLPAEKVSRTVATYELMTIMRSNENNIWELANFECLFVADKKVATYCYNQVAGKIQVGDKVNTAICNSNQHYYELNITGCLLSQKMDPEYISSCKKMFRKNYDDYYPYAVYESMKHCAIPLYGKSQVEDCSLKCLNQSFWPTREMSPRRFEGNQFDPSYESKLRAFQGCLNALRRSKKLDEKYNKCSRLLLFKLEFESVQDICKREDAPPGRTFHFLLRTSEHGTFNRTGECSKAFEDFKSIDPDERIQKWLCKGKGRNENDFVQLHDCSGVTTEEFYGGNEECPGE